VSGAHISRGGIQKVYQAGNVTIHLATYLLPFIFLNFKDFKIFYPKCRQVWVRKEKVVAWGKVEGAFFFFCFRPQKKKKLGNCGAPPQKFVLRNWYGDSVRLLSFPAQFQQPHEESARQQDTFFI
jgi:hypothetical protein